MGEERPKYRTVTLYVRENETLEEYLANARDGYFAEAELKNLMSESQVPIEHVLRDIDEINSEEKAKRKQTKKTRASLNSRTKKKR